MPELPDILGYLTALEPRVVGKRLESVRLGRPFLLRSVPPVSAAEGRTVVGLRRIGKRIALELDGGLFHLRDRQAVRLVRGRPDVRPFSPA